MEKVVYDIGMHTGEDTEFYLKKGFKVIAVEAIPTLAESAQAKFQSEIKSGQLIVINKAIADTDSPTIDFYINEEKDDWGTILPDWNRTLTHDYKKISVETIRLEDIIGNYGMPYYMKIDIEGADTICLRSLLKMGDSPKFLSAELLHPDNLPNEKVDCLEILCLLSAIGYKEFKISDQSSLELVKCPDPSLEGEYIDYKFSLYNSGPFGKELLSRSYSLDEIAIMYLKYFYEARNEKKGVYANILKLIKNNKLPTAFAAAHSWSWFDIHAIKT